MALLRCSIPSGGGEVTSLPEPLPLAPSRGLANVLAAPAVATVVRLGGRDIAEHGRLPLCDWTIKRRPWRPVCMNCPREYKWLLGSFSPATNSLCE